MILDEYYDGVDYVVSVLTTNPDPEKRERIRQLAREYIERLRKEGNGAKEWLQKEIADKEAAMERLRKKVKKAEGNVSRAARLIPFEEGAEARWTAEAVANSQYAVLVDQLEEGRRQHRRVRERLSVLLTLRDRVEADGLPTEWESKVKPPSSRELEHARTLLDVYRDRAAPTSYKMAERRIENAGVEPGVTGDAVVTGAKRAADKLGLDYHGAKELVTVLRSADKNGLLDA